MKSALAALLALAASPADPARSGSDGGLALVGGTVLVGPTEEPIRDGAVLIERGRIAAVGERRSLRLPPDVAILDCSGSTITAGFWNSHVHLFERKWADAAGAPAPELARQVEEVFTAYGFTSVFDTGSPWENTRRLRERIESGEVAGPRIRSTGEALVAPGAIPPKPILDLLGFMTFPAPEITSAAGAAAAARALLDRGADGIKLHLQTPAPPNPPFPQDAIPAAVGEAHRRGKPVFLHPNGGADVQAALRGDVDVIAHTTPRSGPWDETILSAARQGRAALTPTLSLWKHVMRHDRASVRQGLVETAVGQLRAWRSAGGMVLFGTDAGAIEPDPSEEYALMAEAGMGFREILASLTTAPAGRFGESERSGRIAAGLAADLVVLGEDPATDVRGFAAVRYTIRGGRVIHRTGS